MKHKILVSIWHDLHGIALRVRQEEKLHDSISLEDARHVVRLLVW